MYKLIPRKIEIQCQSQPHGLEFCALIVGQIHYTTKHKRKWLEKSRTGHSWIFMDRKSV